MIDDTMITSCAVRLDNIFRGTIEKKECFKSYL